jgi:hypothetical protein
MQNLMRMRPVIKGDEVHITNVVFNFSTMQLNTVTESRNYRIN